MIREDILFLQEMKEELEKGWDNKDITRIEKVQGMIDDWIYELIDSLKGKYDNRG